MAEQLERVDVNMGQNTDRNGNNNPPDDSNYQAWAQYWQYYYSYYMYYYTSYYYLALSQQNSAGVFAPPLPANIPPGAALNGSRNVPQNVPGLRQRLIDGRLVEIFDLRPRTEPQQRYEYRVASLWKRIFAEFIDFVFLYFIKYSLFLLYYKDPDKLNSQFQYIMVIDDNTSMKDIEDILIQALIYRLIVFFYEAFFIAVSFPCKTGGATLGKYMMGITVVLYPGLTPVEGYNLRRFSGIARRLPLWQSCVRATLKNFMITFFFPIMFTTMFLQNYRTPYDFVATSVVVDANPRHLTQQN